MALTLNDLVANATRPVIGTYISASWLSRFRAENIGGIEVTEWYNRNRKEPPAAALTVAGLDPSDAYLAPDLGSLSVFTASEQIILSEADVAFFTRTGNLPRGVEQLGAQVGRTASFYLWRGTSPDGNIPLTQYNFINDAGTSNGTITRPLITSTASAGAWSTEANIATDLAILYGTHIASGFNPATSIAVVPRAAAPTLAQRMGQYDSTSRMDRLRSFGFGGVVFADDEYLYTAASALPTKDLFDIYAIDLSSIVIGYTRPPRLVSVYDDINRKTYLQSEVWFCPLMVPLIRNESGTIKYRKGVTRVTAIATS